MHCCLVYKQCVCILQGKRKMRYLVKYDVKLKKHTVIEDDSAGYSVEDKNWGLKAEDDDDVWIRMSLIFLYFISYRRQYSKGGMVLSSQNIIDYPLDKYYQNLILSYSVDVAIHPLNINQGLSLCFHLLGKLAAIPMRWVQPWTYWVVLWTVIIQ